MQCGLLDTGPYKPGKYQEGKPKKGTSGLEANAKGNIKKGEKLKLFGRLFFVKPRAALSEINEGIGQKIEFEFEIGDKRPLYKAPFLMVPVQDRRLHLKPAKSFSLGQMRPAWKAQRIHHSAIIYRGVRYIREGIK